MNTGDGVLLATTLIEIFRKEGKVFQDYLKDVKSYYSKTVNLRIENKKNLVNNEKLDDKIKEIKEIFNQDCKVIVRPSGTEDLVRVTLMGQDINKVNLYIDELIKFIKEIR